MRRVILVIGGFTEKINEDTGSRQLWEKTLPFSKMEGHDTMVFVLHKKWNHDWKKLAKWLESINVSDCFVCAYSWGAGYGLANFSKAFSGPISCALCDPVYYSRLWSTKWLAAFKWLRPSIKLPRNVTIVKHFKQTLNEPGNDRVKSPNPQPKAIDLQYLHTEIDNSDEYHEAALLEMQRWLKRN